MDARFFYILRQVFDKVDVELHLIPEAVCCGAGVIEERSEPTSLAINARSMAAAAEKMGLPFFTPCSTCFNVISNCRKRPGEDPKLFDQVNEILAGDGIEYKGECQLTHTLWMLAQDVGLEKLTERVTHPLNGLRVASYWSDNRSSIVVFLLSSLAMTRPLSLPGHIKENHNIFQRMFRFIL